MSSVQVLYVKYLWPLGQYEYSSRQMAVTSGIVLAVLVPLLLLIALGWYCWYKQSSAEDSSKSWDYETVQLRKASDQMASPNKVEADGRQTTGSDRSSTLSSTSSGLKKRLYDGVYHTGEPLPDRPSVEFKEKLWDLAEEVADSSVISSDITPSDLSSNNTYSRRQTDIF